MPGTLFVVSTPIGNLEDITYRAVRTLREVRLVACEDTRQTAKLLNHFGIQVPTVSYHDHNERPRSQELLARLIAGEDVALVSDAGTPLLSDPGYRLIRDAIAAGIQVTPVPGSSALLAGLAGAGLPTDAVYFGGFLPPKTGKRRAQLEQHRDDAATLVFYEAPHRILDTLDDVVAALGPDRPVVVAREVTKLHEEFLRGTAEQVRAQLSARPAIKGEITLLIGKAAASQTVSDETVVDEVRRLEAEMPRMEAIKHVARRRGVPKREVYAAVEGGQRPARTNS